MTRAYRKMDRLAEYLAKKLGHPMHISHDGDMARLELVTDDAHQLFATADDTFPRLVLDAGIRSAEELADRFIKIRDQLKDPDTQSIILSCLREQ